MGMENIINNFEGNNISQEYKHEHKEYLCYCCNKLFSKENLEMFRVFGREYGSLFDTMDFTVQLCPECVTKIKQKWFDNNCDTMWGYDEKSEKELWDFLNTFKIENQEYIFNIDTKFEDKIDREDWIELNKEDDQDVREEIAWMLHKESI